MPRIIAAAHSVPEQVVTQTDAKALIREVFQGRLPELERLLSIFDHTRIEKRRLLMSPDWYLRPRSPAEKNRIFLRHGYSLLLQAAESCLAAANCPRSEIDHVIYINSTGHATPTLDARLINDLGLRRQTSRLPVWGLGCAGGAAGLSRAFDFCLSRPEARVLLVAVECCSLTFMPDDLTRKNLVGTALFADGAAAVMVAGDAVTDSGPLLQATGSYLYPDSARIMGWDFVSEGMQLVLSPRLPALIRQSLPSLVEKFLRPHGLEPSRLRHYLTHPGGAKVVEAFRSALALNDAELELTEQVLRDYGNLSSVSVLIVLEQWLASERSRQPGRGLISAFGPGFSAELLLFEV